MDRYVKEAERVIYVLDSHLKKQGTPYLVGDKCTYADLAFVPWGLIIPLIAPDGKIDVESKIDVEGKYPNYDAWMKRLLERPTVKKVLEDRTKAISGH